MRSHCSSTVITSAADVESVVAVVQHGGPVGPLSPGLNGGEGKPDTTKG